MVDGDVTQPEEPSAAAVVPQSSRTGDLRRYAIGYWVASIVCFFVMITFMVIHKEVEFRSIIIVIYNSGKIIFITMVAALLSMFLPFLLSIIPVYVFPSEGWSGWGQAVMAWLCHAAVLFCLSYLLSDASSTVSSGESDDSQTVFVRSLKLLVVSVPFVGAGLLAEHRVLATLRRRWRRRVCA